MDNTAAIPVPAIPGLATLGPAIQVGYHIYPPAQHMEHMVHGLVETHMRLVTKLTLKATVLTNNGPKFKTTF